MMNHFKQFIRYMRKNLFPFTLTASNSDQQHHKHAAQSKKSRDTAWCYNEPVETTCPQPIPEVSRKGKPAPKHLPAALEAALPPYPVLWAYFPTKKYPDTEAEAFYNRFQFVNWKSFGIKPIENWQQLADRWMANVRNCDPSLRHNHNPSSFIDNPNNHD